MDTKGFITIDNKLISKIVTSSEKDAPWNSFSVKAWDFLHVSTKRGLQKIL